MSSLNQYPLEKVRKTLAYINSIDPDHFNLRHAEILLFMDKMGGSITYKEVEEEFDITNASASRNLKKLWLGRGEIKRAFFMLNIAPDPEYGRRHLATLNKKGKEFVRNIYKIMKEK